MNRTVKRILLAESNSNDVELMLDALGRHQLAGAVDIARDGVEAMDYLYARGQYELREKGNPALILLDFIMPRLNGFEVLKQVKADPGLRMIPVLILTSSSHERDMVEKYSEGTKTSAVKAVHFQELVGAVKDLGLF